MWNEPKPKYLKRSVEIQETRTICIIKAWLCHPLYWHLGGTGLEDQGLWWGNKSIRLVLGVLSLQDWHQMLDATMKRILHRKEQDTEMFRVCFPVQQWIFQFWVSWTEAKWPLFFTDVLEKYLPNFSHLKFYIINSPHLYNILIFTLKW